MKSKRWAWLPLLLALPLLALACNGDAESAPPSVDQGGSLTAEEELLASMALTAQEVREALPEEAETSLGWPDKNA